MEHSCLVPICRNTTDTSNKIFVHVPRNSDVQKNWRIALKLPERVHLGRNNVICEDHFDVSFISLSIFQLYSQYTLQLEKDAANWMYYKTMGNKLFLIHGAVPQKYLESPQPSDFPSGLSESAKKRKLETLVEYCHQPMDQLYWHPLQRKLL